jgi:hypothetical protein
MGAPEKRPGHGRLRQQHGSPYLCGCRKLKRRSPRQCLGRRHRADFTVLPLRLRLRDSGVCGGTLASGRGARTIPATAQHAGGEAAV